MARALPGHHILHLIAHGSFASDKDAETNKRVETATLHLEDENGQWARVKDVDMTAKVSGLDSKPQLIFLSACQSATRSETAPFVGLAPRLVRAGVPAVVAMQDRVPMQVARQLTGDFYRALLAHGSVDQALNQARNLLFAAENTDWAIPVLFLRTRGSQLFVLPKNEGERADGALPLTDPEREYLRLLRRECNRLPLAEDRRAKGERGAGQAELARVYIDLQTTALPNLEQILQRLLVPRAQWDSLRQAMTLRQNQAQSTLQRMAAEPMAENDGRWLLPDEKGFERHPLKPWADSLDTLRAAAEQRRTALEVLNLEQRVVLLGQPGSGKSTLVNHFTYLLAGQFLGVDAEGEGEVTKATTLLPNFFPVRIVIRQWSATLTATDRSGMHLIDRAFHQAGLEPEALRPRLESPHTLILFDGLDEAPARNPDELEDGGEGTLDRRRLVMESVEAFCVAHPHCKVLVTSRVKSYREGSYQLAEMPDFELAKLDEERIDRFVHRWYTELIRIGQMEAEEARIARDRLLPALGQRGDLAEMAGTPLLLTMLARVNARRGLPESRAELYHECVEQLLWEWEKVKAQESGGGLESLNTLLQIDDKRRLHPVQVEQVLWQLTFDAHEASGKEVVALSAQTLEQALAKIHPHPYQGKAWAARVVDLMRERGGLLTASDAETFTFPHRTFQEYLAARWLLTQSDGPQQAARLAQDDIWQEVILLACGYLTMKDSYDPNRLQLMVHEMVGGPMAEPAHWRRLMTAGRAWQEYLSHEPVGYLGEELTEKIPHLLTALMQNAAAPPRTRLDAGLLAADLDVLPPDLDEFVPIAARGKLGYDFRIGKYPVTNAQYRRFVQDGGYEENRPWWTPEIVKDIESWLSNKEWRKGPRLWNDHQFNHATQPVVAISWYEAVAYCQWLTDFLRREGGIGQDEVVRLPTEAEWLRVTAGVEGRTYAWGESFDQAKANTKESGFGHPSPVHMYPDGATPEGVWDLCGNEWEWTNDDFRGNRETKTLKGGSWASSADRATAAAAGYWYLRPRDFDLGFRGVVVPRSRER